MDLKTKADQVAELMRKTKEDWIATRPANTDLAIYVHYWRGEDLIATVVCPLDRDTALQASLLGARGYNADTIAFTFEAYHSSLGVSPITGKPWKHKEMQYLAQTDPEAKEKGWIDECMTTSVHERGGGFAAISEVFAIRDDKVEWLERALDIVTDDAGAPDGIIFEYLQQAMSVPKILDHMKSDKSDIAKMMLSLFADNPEEQLFHADVATTKALQEKKLAIAVVLGAARGSEREQWIEERFGSSAEA